MSFFGLLLLFFLGYFIVWPIIKTVMRVNRVRQNFYSSMNGDNREAPRRERQGGWSSDGVKPRRKKIGRDVGEYVAFEENPDKMPPTSAAADNFVSEQQVEDAEWEEIKNK